MSKLTELLDFYEENINPEQIQENYIIHKKYLNYQYVNQIPTYVSFPQDRFTKYPLEETHNNLEKMMYNELLNYYCHTVGNSCGIPMIRANYGVGTLPSLFGLNCRIINNNMPWVDHVNSIDNIKEIINNGIPNLDTGFGKMLTQTHKFYSDILSKYPKCKKYIKVFHPDFQGPFDVAHLIWGPDIYTALYDEPDLVHELMDLITRTYIAIMKRTKKEINDTLDNYCFHWGFLYKGSLVLRNDSAVNISANTFNEFIKPYDEKILLEFGGGSMHYCGRADHLVSAIIEEKGLLGMNFGIVPSLVMGIDHLEFIRDRFEEKKIPIVNYGLSLEEYKVIDKKRFNTGISLHVYFDTKDKAKKLSFFR